MNWSPALTGSALSDFVIDRSASVSTDVVSVSLSLVSSGSMSSDAVIDAVLLKTVPDAVLDGTSTFIVSVAVSPLFRAIPVHKPVPELYVPSVTVELMNVNPAGIASVTCIPVASDGPLFVTSIV